VVSSIHSAAYRKFIRRLRAGRELAGLTQKEAAAKLRKPQSWLSRCESGERRVDAIELYTFSQLYKLPITWFFED
jgi:transcriptional regulator with XRE-family HTH domain